jgi:hypothetical protein
LITGRRPRPSHIGGLVAVAAAIGRARIPFVEVTQTGRCKWSSNGDRMLWAFVGVAGSLVGDPLGSSASHHTISGNSRIP